MRLCARRRGRRRGRRVRCDVPGAHARARVAGAQRDAEPDRVREPARRGAAQAHHDRPAGAAGAARRAGRGRDGTKEENAHRPARRARHRRGGAAAAAGRSAAGRPRGRRAPGRGHLPRVRDLRHGRIRRARPAARPPAHEPGDRLPRHAAGAGGRAVADDRGRERPVGMAGARARLGAGAVFGPAHGAARTALAAGAAGGRHVPDAGVGRGRDAAADGYLFPAVYAARGRGVSAARGV